jgi:predicted dehydrogenase
VISIDPGEATLWSRHTYEELFYAVSGSGVIELRRDGSTERIEIEPVDSYRLEAENMSAAVRGEQPLLLGRAEALGQARAIEALYAAAEQQRVVALS